MFIYLNKKIAIPNGVVLRCCYWNTDQGWIACGGEGGLLKVLKLESAGKGKEKGIAGSSNLTMNQTLEGHAEAVVCAAWNEAYKKLTTSDESGLIIVWMLHKGMWFEEMINNRNKSVVKDMKWNADGQKICIVYEDGAVIVGSVDGNRLWGKDLKMQLQYVEWSPDGKMILFVTPQGVVHIYDSLGNYISPTPLLSDDNTATIAGLSWYNCLEGLVDPNAPTLAIAFDTGRIQLMTSEMDEKPILIDTGLRPSEEKAGLYRLPIQWNSAGSVLAVAGVQAKQKQAEAGKDFSQVQFYDPFGHHLRTLKVPGSGISGLAWEGGGLRIALAVESFIYFANIRPDYKWGYFSNTLVYAYTKPERSDHCVVFFDTQTGATFVKYVKKLMLVRACGEYCVLLTRTDDPGQYILILCNAIGAPVDSKYVNIEPFSLYMTRTHIIAASTDVICVWQYSSKVSKLTSIDTPTSMESVALKRKDGKEAIWHVDEMPSMNAGGFDKFKNTRSKTEDSIACVCASDTMLIVSRESGTLQRYSLPHIALESKYIVRCCPQLIELNCNSTKLALIDLSGVLSLFDLEAGKGKASNEMGIPPGEHLAFERKDAWDMRWADDNPDLLAMMEKSRMYIFRGQNPEEPVLSSGYLCNFSNLSITAVLLDEVYANPDKPDLEVIVNFETKSLRDTRDMIKLGIADATQFIEDNPHMRLWKLLSESALDKLDFSTAEKAFVRMADYYGIQFVKRLVHLGDKDKQRAEVAVYFKRLDEAEKMYKDMDRLDLAVDLRARLGDWFRVKQLIPQGGGDDALLTKAYVNMGEYYFDRQMWKKAFEYFERGSATARQVDCLYNLEDYETLVKLVTDPKKQLPEGSPLLLDIGDKLASVGLGAEAVQSLLRANAVKAAIDCCVLLNQWDMAITLANEHNFPQIEGLLTNYAALLLKAGRRMEAVELYRKASRHPDAAKLLAEIADEVVRSRANPMRARRLYVLAALEVEKYRQKKYNVQPAGGTLTTMGGLGTLARAGTVKGGTMAGGGGGGATVRNTQATMATLDGLMQGDADASDNKILDRAWRGVEAMELFLMAHKNLYAGRVDAAMKCAQALGDYEDIVDPGDVYSLLGLTSFHNQMFAQCSTAMMRLELLPAAAPARREQCRALSFEIFTRFQPRDTTVSEEQKRADRIDDDWKRKLRKKYLTMCSPKP